MKVKKYRNGGKNGDPKKNGFDKEPEKKKPTGGSGKNPTISAGAKKDVDRAVHRSKQQAAKEEKYQKRAAAQNKKYHDEMLKRQDITRGENESKERFRKRQNSVIEEQYNIDHPGERTRAMKDLTSKAIMERWDEAQRMKKERVDKSDKAKQQGGTARRLEKHKLGGKIKVKKYKKGGKVKDKLKALTKKKKTPKGYDVSVGGNVDYNKPHKKTSFASSSMDRNIANKKLSQKLLAAGVEGAENTKAKRKAITTKRGDKYTRSTEVSSPMDVKMYGGKMKKYAKGGKHKKC